MYHFANSLDHNIQPGLWVIRIQRQLLIYTGCFTLNSETLNFFFFLRTDKKEQNCPDAP